MQPIGWIQDVQNGEVLHAVRRFLSSYLGWGKAIHCGFFAMAMGLNLQCATEGPFGSRHGDM